MNSEVLNFYSGQAVPASNVEYHEGYYYNTSTHDFVASNTYSCVVIKLEDIDVSLFVGPFAAFALLDVVKQPSSYYGDARLLFMTDLGSVSETILKNVALYSASQGNDRLYTIPSPACRVIVINKVQTEPKDMYLVYKHNPIYSSCVKNYKKENDQIFMRESLSTDAKYLGSDYKYFKSLAMDSANFFCITRNSSSSIYIKGEFSKVDCKFDISKQQCTIDVRILDMYSRILNKYSEQVDVIKANPVSHSIKVDKEGAIQVYMSGARTTTIVVGGQWHSEDLVGDSLCVDPAVLGNTRSAQDTAYDNYQTLKNRGFYPTCEMFNEFTVTNCSGTDSQGGNLSRFNGTYFGKCPRSSSGSYAPGNQATFYKIGDTSLAIRITNVLDIGGAFPYQGIQLYDVELIDLTNNLVCYANSQYTEFRLKCRYPWDSDDESNYVIQPYLYSNTCQYNAAGATTNSGNYAHIAITLYWVFYRFLSDSTGSGSISVRTGDSFIPANRYKYAYQGSWYFLNQYQSGNYFIYSVNTQDEATRYPKSTLTDKFFVRPNVSYDGRVIFPLCPSEWQGVAMWGVIWMDNDYTSHMNSYRATVSVPDAYKIVDIIIFLLSLLNLNIIFDDSVECSQFLYSQTFVIPPEHSVGGVSTDILGIRLYVTPSSNVIVPNYSAPAASGKISLKDIFDMLRNIYNCYWFIDENSKLRIEHIKYFMNGLSYSNSPSVLFDFTNKADAYNGKNIIFDQYQIEYVKQGFFSERTISFSNSECSQVFAMNILRYSGYFLRDSDESNLDVSRFDADLVDMQVQADNYSKDNFALLAVEMGAGSQFGINIEKGCPAHTVIPAANTVYFADSDGIPTPVIVSNILASALYVMQFMFYNVPSLTNFETKGAKGITPQTQLRFMSQKVEVSLTQDLEYLGLVHTNLGDGMIMDMQVDMITRKAKLELRYFPV